MQAGNQAPDPAWTPPPAPLATALDDPQDKAAWVSWLFSRVARRYDVGNDIMSLGWHTRWKRRLVASAAIAPTHRVLDIAAGTGDTTWMVAALTKGDVVGTDVNADMLALAERKRKEGSEHVRFAVADAAHLPFPDASFERVTCTYAGRGFNDWRPILAEIHRVLVPGGEFWNLDFARPENRVVDVGYRGWLTISGAVLGVCLHGSAATYTYIPASMARYPGQRWLAEQMRAVGFETEVEATFLELMAFHRGRKSE